jgi:serpin B
MLPADIDALIVTRGSSKARRRQPTTARNKQRRLVSFLMKRPMDKPGIRAAWIWLKRSVLIVACIFLGCGIYHWLAALVIPSALGTRYVYQEWPQRSCNARRMKSLAADNNAFACDLYQALRKSRTDNLTCSPFSLSLGMAMVYAGARGDTRQQIANGMHFTLSDTELVAAFADQCYRLNTGIGGTFEYGGKMCDSSVLTANSLWVDHSVELVPEYRQLINETLNAKVETVDFSNQKSVTAKVNEWTAIQTQGQLTDYVAANAIPPRAAFVLVNCVLLNAAWQINCSFPEVDTQDAAFFLSGEEQVTVPMMEQEGPYRVAVADKFVALDMPLEFSRNVSFIVILPNEITGLDQLESELSAALLQEIRSNLSTTLVELYLPRFAIEGNIDADRALQALGIADVFSSKANLSGIGSCGINKLCLSKVIHNARTEVDETGVRAAAVSQLVGYALGISRPPPDKIVFRADHPFAFLIQDTETGAVLFMGRVLNPLSTT